MRAMSSASWQCSIYVWARRQRSSAADGQSHHEEGLKRSRGGGAARRLGPTRAAGRRASVRPSGSGSGRPGRPSRHSLAKEFKPSPSLKHRWDNKMRLPNTWLHRLTLTFPAFTLLYYGSLIARQPARSRGPVVVRWREAARWWKAEARDSAAAQGSGIMGHAHGRAEAYSSERMRGPQQQRSSLTAEVLTRPHKTEVLTAEGTHFLTHARGRLHAKGYTRAHHLQSGSPRRSPHGGGTPGPGQPAVTRLSA